MMRRPRVLVGLVEIAGHYGALAEGLRRLGYDTSFVEVLPHPFAYARHDTRLPAVLEAMRMGLARLDKRAPVAVRIAAHAAFKASLLPWALQNHDVFVLGFASTFLRYFDLPLLKRLGKRIVYVFNGSDSRPPYLDGARLTSDLERRPHQLRALTARRKQIITRINRFADVIVDNAMAAHFHTRPIVEWHKVGFALERPHVRFITPTTASASRVRILHAPSHSGVKGSDRVRDAVRALTADGIAADLVEISGRPNDEVIAAIHACDFVVDQAYSDVPMAGFAAESALAGRPAVVGSYAAPLFARFIDAVDMPPTWICDPDGLPAAVRRLATDGALREELGRRAHAFASSRWSVAQVAERFAPFVESDPAPSATFDPASVENTLGAGLARERCLAAVHLLVSRFGPGALMLDDKPRLRDAILRQLR